MSTLSEVHTQAPTPLQAAFPTRPRGQTLETTHTSWTSSCRAIFNPLLIRYLVRGQFAWVRRYFNKKINRCSSVGTTKAHADPLEGDSRYHQEVACLISISDCARFKGPSKGYYSKVTGTSRYCKKLHNTDLMSTPPETD